MTKILDEVRAISSEAVAKKQDAAKNKMPELIKQIKGAAALGKTSCEFPQYAIDEYSQKLLSAEGFHVYATTRRPKMNDYKSQFLENGMETVWSVSW